MAPSAPREMAFLALAAMAFLSLVGLALSAWMAARSRRPRVQKPRRKTFEHGHRRALRRKVSTTEEACEALANVAFGQLVSLLRQRWRIDVTIRRKRSQPCAQMTGFLSGLFESAWAHEVVISHPACSGVAGECRYVVERVAIASARPTAAASIRGSASAPGRSPQVRPGAG